jgi:cytochrome b pre-mRNA-processing protein 3
MLTALKKNNKERELANRLHEAIIGRARAPEFFATFGVPDTLDGRFDLVVLHSWLALGRLREPALHDVSQRLTNMMFAAFDEGLRELGVSDTGMGRRMKKIANAFYGRFKAYDDAGEDETAMADALVRNLYRGNEKHAEAAKTLAGYIFTSKEALAKCDPAQGELDFGPLPQ